MGNKSSVILLFLFTLVALLTEEVNAQKVFSDHNTSVDFKKYKTYAWIAPGDSVLNKNRHDKLYGGYIMYAANEELKKKGMILDGVNPDAVFIFNTQVQDKTKYTQSATLSVGVGVAGPGYYAAGSVPVAGGEITESTVTDGMLSFDMYDTKTRNLLWSGGATKTFSVADDVEKLISDYTKLIFRKLPVKIK